ncbi:MAG: potassium channel family protein [Acidimicrobiales bacterium]
MTNIARRLAQGAGDDAAVDDPSGRLAAYMAKTQTALDLLAMVTLWIVVVPPGDFKFGTAALVGRIALSVVYGIDMAIRSRLARRHVYYLVTHPIGVLSVIAPPVRVVFSLRLVRSIFQRGNLARFLLAASVMVLNGAVIVYLYERHAPGSNIHTFGESVWWSVVTVTTVGYGDFYPVTTQGRITAGFIMAIGILTLAVITAQVASSFVTEESSGPRGVTPSGGTTPEAMLAELDRRLDRIETLLTASVATRGQPGRAPDAE